MEKCANLQKLLQESLEDKQRHHHEFVKQKTQMEMEIAQLRMPKSESGDDAEESSRFGRIVAQSEERIRQLEMNLQQSQSNEAHCSNENAALRNEVEAL